MKFIPVGKSGMKERFKKLIDVKSIVTVLLTIVFMVLSLRREISSDQFLVIFTTVVAFYYGTQHEKTGKSSKPNGGKS